MALPAFAPGTGPFGSSPGRWSTDPSRLSQGERAAAASLYAALVSETCLSLAGAQGPVVVEGPFGGNPTFLAALGQLIPRPVIARPDATGTTDGAALLAAGPEAKPDLRDAPAVKPLDIDLSAYAMTWTERATA